MTNRVLSVLAFMLYLEKFYSNKYKKKKLGTQNSVIFTISVKKI